MNAITQQCLNAHNEYRRKHGAPPLVISDSVRKLFKRIFLLTCYYSNFASCIADENGPKLGPNECQFLSNVPQQ